MKLDLTGQVGNTYKLSTGRGCTVIIHAVATAVEIGMRGGAVLISWANFGKFVRPVIQNPRAADQSRVVTRPVPVNQQEVGIGRMGC